jgi:hypothetical protein
MCHRPHCQGRRRNAGDRIVLTIVTEVITGAARADEWDAC